MTRTSSSHAPLPYPTLCLVTDLAIATGQSLLDKVAAALDGGADAVQLRARELPAGALLALAGALRNLTAKKALLFINDRVDVALAVEADGVQLGEESLTVEAVRRIAARRLLVGRSVHSREGARQAQAQGADFLVVGTIFPTNSKPDAIPSGLELLRGVSKAVTIPFLGIGGVSATNAPDVLAAGAYGAAVISAILSAPDAREATRNFKLAMASAVRRKVLS